MTTNTMVAIQTITASSQSAVSFTSIPSTYTDLHIVAVGTSSTAGSSVNYWRMTFNGDSSSGLYSDTYLYGNGSSAASSRDTGGNFMYLGYVGQTSNTAQPISTFDIMNYANSTTYKTVLARGSAASDNVGAMVGLWRNTNAINRVDLFMSSATVSGTFTLYGIANADIGAYATGGIITQDSTYYYHAFGSSGTFTPSRNLTADILVVAGGGAGGAAAAAGGGGAGGIWMASSQSLSSGTNYTCTVGAGGAGASNTVGGNGGNSTFGAISGTIYGGGGGAGQSVVASSGGSGGGAAYTNPSSVGSGTSGQGNAGGTGHNFSLGAGGGGGGGAGGVGQNSATNDPGPAGAGGVGAGGTSWSYTGIANPYLYLDAMGAATSTGQIYSGHYYYAGGGGGGVDQAGSDIPGSAGIGGGAAGSNAAGIAATQFTGGGGGGGGHQVGSGGNGGSGIVIVRYAK